MSPELAELIPQFAIGAVVQLGFVWILVTWGRWAALRQGNGRWWRWLANAPIFALVLSVLGIIATVATLLHAWSAVEGAAAAEKATLLANGISRAMAVTAGPLILSWLLYAAAFIAALIGTFKAPSASSRVAPSTSPPAA